jgi:hypothetical protein
MEWRPGGHRVRGRELELVEEVRVGCREVEGDRVGGRVGHDPLREIARRLRSGKTALCTDDLGEVEPRTERMEQCALDRTPEIGRTYDRPGRVADAGTQMEGVRAAPVGRDGK